MDERGKGNFDPREPALESKNREKKQIPPPSYRRDEEWVKEYIMQFGEEPSFF